MDGHSSSFLGPRSSTQTFHLSLSDHKAVIIHLAGCVSYSMGPKSSAPCIRWLIIHFAWLYLVTFIISLGAEIIHPKWFIYNLSNHKAMIILLGSCEFYGAEIIHSTHPLTNHLFHFYIWCLSSFLGLKSSTSNVPLIHLSGHKAVIVYLAVCVSFYGAKIIHPMHWLTNHSYHKASIIYLVSVGPRSSTPPLHWLIIHNTRPQSSTSCQQCLHYMGLRSSTPCMWLHLSSDHEADTHHLSWGHVHPTQKFHW